MADAVVEYDGRLGRRTAGRVGRELELEEAGNGEVEWGGKRTCTKRSEHEEPFSPDRDVSMHVKEKAAGCESKAVHTRQGERKGRERRHPKARDGRFHMLGSFVEAGSA